MLPDDIQLYGQAIDHRPEEIGNAMPGSLSKSSQGDDTAGFSMVPIKEKGYSIERDTLLLQISPSNGRFVEEEFALP